LYEKRIHRLNCGVNDILIQVSIMKKSAPISFRITQELKDALARLAKADRRSLSAYIELALEAHVEAKKSRRRGDE